MRKLLEKYYNINYYCAYKLLFFIFERMLNPFYWLSLLKWDNRYIKWLVLIGKKIEEGGMDKGIYLPYSTMALSTPITISFWIFSLVCLVCSKILSVHYGDVIRKKDLDFWKLDIYLDENNCYQSHSKTEYCWGLGHILQSKTDK